MKTTCGIFLINTLNSTVLLCHPTNAPLLKWSIPKGELEEGETYTERAIKELYNETGISIKPSNIQIELPFSIYSNKRKRLKSFIVDSLNVFLPPYLSCEEMVNNLYPEIDLYVWAPFNLAYILMHESQSRVLKFFLETNKESNF